MYKSVVDGRVEVAKASSSRPFTKVNRSACWLEG